MRRIVLVVLMGAMVGVLCGSGSAGARASLKQVVASHLHAHWMSQGARAWLNPPKVGSADARRIAPRASSLSFGSNVDAASTVEDLLAGQSETAIDATTSGQVMAAWNDATGFAFLQGNRLEASLTGVGYSTDGGASYTDLVGLRNPNPDQQWSGDPTVVSIDGGAHFVVGSLFLPSLDACADGKPAQLTVAVEVLTPTATGVTMGKPVVTSKAGNACELFQRNPPPNIAFLDKDFLSWDQSTRTLAMSFTRFFASGNHTGQGEIDIARAHVPANATLLTSSDFHTTLVWPEEPNAENEGAYVAVAPGGDTYVAWERNVDTNLFFGRPARLRARRRRACRRERAAQRREEQPDRRHQGPDQRDTGRRCQVSRRHRDRRATTAASATTSPASPGTAPAAASSWHGTTPACTHSATSGCVPTPPTLGNPSGDRAGKRRLRLRASLPAGRLGSLQRAHLHVMV